MLEFVILDGDLLQYNIILFLNFKLMTAYSEEGCINIKSLKYKYSEYCENYDLSYNERYNVSSA